MTSSSIDPLPHAPDLYRKYPAEHLRSAGRAAFLKIECLLNDPAAVFYKLAPSKSGASPKCCSVKGIKRDVAPRTRRHVPEKQGPTPAQAGQRAIANVTKDRQHPANLFVSVLSACIRCAQRLTAMGRFHPQRTLLRALPTSRRNTACLRTLCISWGWSVKPLPTHGEPCTHAPKSVEGVGGKDADA